MENLFNIDPDLQEAYHEQEVYERQFDSAFVYPEWLAWINCPLFKWLDKRRRAQDRAEAVRQSMEYARKFGLMMIETEKGIEFKKAAIVRRIQ